MGRGEVRKQVEDPAKDMEHCFLHFDKLKAPSYEGAFITIKISGQLLP